MKFLALLQNTNWKLTRIFPLTLLDMAYITVLLPIFIMLKAPMMLFSLIVLVILFFKKSPASKKLIFFIFMLGSLAIYLSLYGAFSFSGLSRLKIFLELLIYVLIVVVSMQRLTREINLYLIVSPFLFLALSLFFYHGMLMLVYVVFEVFFLLWMILAHRMEGSLVESFRSSMLMFMYSLPWVVVLFIFFPRISFEHANYGFKGEVIKRMGHDGTMFIDGNALLVPSERIVMEVGFEGEIPAEDTLYFRGSILYVDKKDHWKPLPAYPKRETRVNRPLQGKVSNYKVTLYPTQKRWLYLLDMPKKEVKGSTLDRDLITRVDKNIKEPVHYLASSLLSHTFYDVLDEATYRASTLYYKDRNPQAYIVAQEIKNKYPLKEKRASAVVDFFKAQALTYTLQPDALDINRSTDSFLFDKRRGYCVHYASSFVTMARMTGIPSRIVTGYKSDKSESLDNYLVVKEKDAHAWAELYINSQWVRFETTTTARYIDMQNQLNSIQQENPTLQSINLYLMYVKYQVETWILYYSHARQLQLLDYAKKNPMFIVVFVLSLIVLLIITFVIIAYLRRPMYSSEALYILQPLLKSLKKRGYTRKKEESIHQFLLHYISDNPQHLEVKEIDILYEKILYASNTSKLELVLLKKLIKKSLATH
ncbi:MAG: DUF3488 domain-containing transglutaminase family protein [Sulfurovum sp.]|nr:DUF3488 domain-containing transglutaminase family protein [Sulfurovum sp.]